MPESYIYVDIPKNFASKFVDISIRENKDATYLVSNKTGERYILENGNKKLYTVPAGKLPNKTDIYYVPNSSPLKPSRLCPRGKSFRPSSTRRSYYRSNGRGKRRTFIHSASVASTCYKIHYKKRGSRSPRRRSYKRSRSPRRSHSRRH